LIVFYSLDCSVVLVVVAFGFFEVVVSFFVVVVGFFVVVVGFFVVVVGFFVVVVGFFVVVVSFFVVVVNFFVVVVGFLVVVGLGVVLVLPPIALPFTSKSETTIHTNIKQLRILIQIMFQRVFLISNKQKKMFCLLLFIDEKFSFGI